MLFLLLWPPVFWILWTFQSVSRLEASILGSKPISFRNTFCNSLHFKIFFPGICSLLCCSYAVTLVFNCILHCKTFWEQSINVISTWRNALYKFYYYYFLLLYLLLIFQYRSIHYALHQAWHDLVKAVTNGFKHVNLQHVKNQRLTKPQCTHDS